MNLKQIALGAVLFISGCGHTSEPRIITRTVEVPVVVPCGIPPPAVPDFADTDAKLAAAPNHIERVRALVVGRLQHYAYEGELRAHDAAC